MQSLRSVSIAVLALCLAALDAPLVGGQTTQGAASLGEPPPVTQSLQALDDLLTGYLQSMRPDRDHPNRPAAVKARQAVTRLLELSVKWPAQSPRDYRVNLDREVQGLRALLEAQDQRQLGASMAALAEDLEIKLEHCVKSGGRLGGSVTVRVRTVRDGQEVANWQVHYLPRVLETAPGAAADRFPQLSSPTQERLVPGRYVMWSSDPANGRLGQKAVVKIGEGRQDLTIDLTVPGS